MKAVTWSEKSNAFQNFIAERCRVRLENECSEGDLKVLFCYLGAVNYNSILWKTCSICYDLQQIINKHVSNSFRSFCAMNLILVGSILTTRRSEKKAPGKKNAIPTKETADE